MGFDRTRLVNFTLPIDERFALEKEAARQKISVAELVRRIVRPAAHRLIVKCDPTDRRGPVKQPR